MPLLRLLFRRRRRYLREEFGARYAELESTAHGRRLIPSFLPLGF